MEEEKKIQRISTEKDTAEQIQQLLTTTSVFNFLVGTAHV